MSARASMVCPVLLLSLVEFSGAAQARTYLADPSNYKTFLSALQPGDTLSLAAGRYLRLALDGVHGTQTAEIVVRGPTSGSPAVIDGEPGYNTVQLYGCSYLVLEDLTVDGRGYDVDGVNAKDSVSHHITVQRCTFLNLDNNQQTVAISTKATAWNWVVRGNRILSAGTGMYFGDSDGSSPFIAGLIEGNLVQNSIGYGIQIKFQLAYALSAGMPAGPNRTIIRNNVLIKDDRPSPSGDRPNLLVDGFPDSGPGASDLYEIYGNFLDHNPRESLIQASGRVAIHDNIFVDAGSDQTAILLTDHDRVLRLANVYNNTVFGGLQGIRLASQPRQEGRIIGNMVFAASPISICGGCSLAANQDNVAEAVASAGNFVNAPSTTLGTMDFYPRADCVACSGPALDLGPFALQDDYALDFNGNSKGALIWRGAYAGSGLNPGWRLSADLKVGGPGSGGGAGSPDSVPPSSVTDLHSR